LCTKRSREQTGGIGDFFFGRESRWAILENSPVGGEEKREGLQLIMSSSISKAFVCFHLIYQLSFFKINL
jgi:hypothetical protein